MDNVNNENQDTGKVDLSKQNINLSKQQDANSIPREPHGQAGDNVWSQSQDNKWQQGQSSNQQGYTNGQPNGGNNGNYNNQAQNMMYGPHMNMGGGYNAGNGFGSSFGQNGNTNCNFPGYSTLLVAGIAQVVAPLACCCVSTLSTLTGLCAGIVTLVLVLVANSDFQSGNTNSCMQKVGIAKIVNIVGWVIIVILVTISIILGLIGVNEELLIKF